MTDSEKSDSKKVYINKLMQHYKNKNYVAAEKIAKLAIKKYPDLSISWKILGAVLRQTERLEESFVAYKNVTKTFPDDHEGFFGLANVYQNLNQLHDAKESYLKAISLNPKYPEAFNNLGIIYKKLNKFKDAEAAHREAIILNPTDAAFHNNLGVLHKILGKYEKALICYEKAILLNSDYSEAHENLAYAYQELGRFEDAELSYRDAIALKPSNSASHNNLGLVLRFLGKFEEALLCFQKAISLKPDNDGAHENLAYAYQELGRFEDAELSYRDAIALKPSNSASHNNLGLVLRFLGKFEEALLCFQKAISLKPDNDGAHINLGQEFFRFANYKKASEHFGLSKIQKAKSYNLRCLYYIDETLFFNLFDKLISEGERNAIIGHIGCLSRVKFNSERNNPFCNSPLKYIYTNDLRVENDFTDDFINPIQEILNEKKTPKRRQDLLVKGTQTFGNIFDSQNDSIKKIKKIIFYEIEKYRIHFQKSKEGFIKHWPKNFDLYGWIIKMKSEGKLHPHMHDTGWITGSVYINIPTKTSSNNGNIVVSINDREQPFQQKLVHEKVIDVFTGTICFFPASLLHHTIPFSSKEDRIVLAFDVIPK